jgi:hypothetical protein
MLRNARIAQSLRNKTLAHQALVDVSRGKRE